MPIFQFISKIFDDPDPVIVMPFGGYANHSKLYAQARVLEDEGIEHTEDDGFLKNLYNSFKRFETDEIENAKVRVQVDGKTLTLHSDNEGYLYVDASHSVTHSTGNATDWIPITYELIVNEKVIHTVEDRIMFPSKNAAIGIISDMDETVIHTGLTSMFKWRVLVNSVFKHSSSRLPLEGVQEFYNLLHRGFDGSFDNPFFYLSNSPWNLHEYLTDFLAHHEFPKGTLLLRDIGISNKKHKDFRKRNKFTKISHILETYPKLPFILIGDAVDLDHEIYIEIARQFPNRIAAIYIRTVENKRRMKEVKAIVEAATGIEVALIQNTEEAMLHARQHEFIPSS